MAFDTDYAADAWPVLVEQFGETVVYRPAGGESRTITALVRRSRLSWDATSAALHEAGACVDSRDVLIHRIRRKFADVGAGDPIETVRGWGIRFRTEPDRDGSTAFWIGATEGEMVVA